jgi:hypothetical protein
MIGEPYWCPRGLDPVPTKTCICIEANAKNSYGGFTGVEKSGFKFASPTEFTGEMNGRAEAPKRS